MRYPTCEGCLERPGCELLGEWKRKLRGLGLTSARFLCDAKWRRLRPGTTVTTEVRYPDPALDTEEDQGFNTTTVTGTVMQPSRGGKKLWLWVDDTLRLKGDGSRHVYAFRPDRLTPLDTPHRPLCQWCNAPLDRHPGLLGDWWCERTHNRWP